jgi:hypothetical protein
MITLYTNLPYVNETPDMMRHDLNMITSIKIKLLRAGFFNLDNLSKIQLSKTFILQGIDIGVDRAIHILSTIKNSDRVQEFRELALAWTSYIINNYQAYRHLLTPIEDLFIQNRIMRNGTLPLFASLESYSPGEYVIRV